MSFTPKPLPRRAAPEEISQTTNINFALLQSTIKSLEDQVNILKKKKNTSSDDTFAQCYAYTVAAGV